MLDELTTGERRQVELIACGSRLLASLAIGSISMRKAFGADSNLSAEEFFLKYGVPFRPQPFPSRYRKWKGALQDCQHNAFILAVSCPELDYVEGYALPAANILQNPVPHAWCADAQRNVVDPTWYGRRLGEEYCGLALDKEFLCKAFRKGDPFGLLFNETLFLDVVSGKRKDWPRWLAKRAGVRRSHRRLPS